MIVSFFNSIIKCTTRKNQRFLNTNVVVVVVVVVVVGKKESLLKVYYVKILIKNA